MAKYRKKPVVIEAIRWDGNNIEEANLFLAGARANIPILPLGKDGDVRYHGISIVTLEGRMMAEIGDWIIKGVKGEFYPCKPDIFAVTYEPAE